MTDKRLVWVIVALSVWMFRWDVGDLNEDSEYYKLDRLTGVTFYCKGTLCSKSPSY